MDDIRSSAILFAQGMATILWWPIVSMSAEAQQLFFAAQPDASVLAKFAAPDILVFGFGSILTSILAIFAPHVAKFAAWIIVGAAAYASVGALAVNWPLFSVPLADALMIGTVATSAYCAVRLTAKNA